MAKTDAHIAAAKGSPNASRPHLPLTPVAMAMREKEMAPLPKFRCRVLPHKYRGFNLNDPSRLNLLQTSLQISGCATAYVANQQAIVAAPMRPCRLVRCGLPAAALFRKMDTTPIIPAYSATPLHTACALTIEVARFFFAVGESCCLVVERCNLFRTAMRAAAPSGSIGTRPHRCRIRRRGIVSHGARARIAPDVATESHNGDHEDTVAAAALGICGPSARSAAIRTVDCCDTRRLLAGTKAPSGVRTTARARRVVARAMSLRWRPTPTSHVSVAERRRGGKRGEKVQIR